MAISKEAKDLIRSCLEKNPLKKINLQLTLRTPIFKESGINKLSVDILII